MTQEEVFEVLKKHILDQLEDEVEESDIDIEKSMLDLGANSLDIVEIVTNTMRELKIKIPRDELASINTMKGLVEAMTEIKNR
ncbi:MAG: acyl carrier protein [Proteobacteria bacterium]|nr:acyl carrier protein [Pseudomonadota bacterium]